MADAGHYDESGRSDQTYGFGGPGTAFVAISLSGLILSSCLVTNRLFWRLKNRIPWLDDISIFFAWVSQAPSQHQVRLAELIRQISLTALSVVSLMAVNYGYGRRQQQLTRHEATQANKVRLASQESQNRHPSQV